MLLKDLLVKIGDFCFRHRTLQYIPYAIVILAELKDFNRVHESIPFEIICFAVTLFGIIIRILTIGYVPKNTSGRNRKEQIADTLNTKGMYSIVRNPLYLGNFFIFLGISILTESFEIIILNSILMTLFYTAIVLKEESFLAEKFGKEYLDWTKKVNCFIPSFKNFKKCDRNFSIEKVIFNEHDTWMSTIVCFICIETIKGFFETERFFLAPVWIYVFTIFLLIWAISKFLKKAKILNPKREL